MIVKAHRVLYPLLQLSEVGHQLRVIIAIREAWDRSIDNTQKQGDALMPDSATTQFDYFTEAVGFSVFSSGTAARKISEIQTLAVE